MNKQEIIKKLEEGKEAIKEKISYKSNNLDYKVGMIHGFEEAIKQLKNLQEMKMTIKIPKKFDKWNDKLVCPKCKEKEVVSYWYTHQKIIGAKFDFQCKNCFAEFEELKKGDEDAKKM